jgi:hypothetical protein
MVANLYHDFQGCVLSLRLRIGEAAPSSRDLLVGSEGCETQSVNDSQ